MPIQKKKHKILIINSNCSWNKGSAAQVISTVETLRKIIQNADFTLMSDYYPELDKKSCKIHGINVINQVHVFPEHELISAFVDRSIYVFRCMIWASVHLHKIPKDEVLRHFVESDLIIDLSGDSLSDCYNISVLPLLNDFLAILLRKKIAAYSQSIGPFKKLTQPLARFYLNSANLIIVRDKETIENLKKIGCTNKNIHLSADVAFALSHSSSERGHEILSKEGFENTGSKPLVGLGTSALLYRKSEHRNKLYLASRAKLADYIVENLNAHLLLIPHMIYPNKFDDRNVAAEIYQLSKNKSEITVIKGDYEPEEIKSIISSCMLFIGNRMHSNIASVSMGVPTIAIGWSYKYAGLMKTLGIEKFCLDFRTATFEELVSKIDDAWLHRAEIRQSLSVKIPELERSVAESGLLIKKLLDQPTV
jgi:colanic acid/amylovoran biosynthesis protein